MLVPTLLRRAMAHGAALHLSSQVVSLSLRGRDWRLATEAGDVWWGDQMVVAAGNQTRDILGWLNLPCPVSPVRCQVIITEPLAPLIHHTLSAMRQMQNGEILIGYSHEENREARDVSLPYLTQAAELAQKWVPRLAGAPIIRSFAGIRVMPRDGLPILGPVADWLGLSVAAMHSGYTLAPIVGQLAQEWLTGKTSSVNLWPYRLERFF